MFVSHKMVSIENKAALKCATVREHARAFAAII